jgi:hypothetical protein
MLNPQNGKIVRMFKCECGAQTWTTDLDRGKRVSPLGDMVIHDQFPLLTI